VVATLPPEPVAAAPPPVFAPPSTAPSPAFALVVPLLLLGALLLGASAVSVRRIPWPAVAVPLAVHRFDVAAAGVGAIALALLVLNITVFL
jgi:hypothetical protein